MIEIQKRYPGETFHQGHLCRGALYETRRRIFKDFGNTETELKEGTIILLLDHSYSRLRVEPSQNIPDERHILRFIAGEEICTAVLITTSIWRILTDAKET